MRFYVLNLPHRTDRLAHFTREYNREIGDKRSDDSIVVMEAIDGRKHSLTDAQQQLFKRARFLRYRNAPSIVGCLLSHLCILQHIVTNNVPFAVVFEDDAVLVSDFRRHLDDVVQQLPPDAEFVSLSLHAVANMHRFEPWPLNDTYDSTLFIQEQITPAVGRMKHDQNPCTLAYLVTLEGARKYLHHVYTHGAEAEADHNLHDYLKARNIFYASVKVLCTGNETLGTDIQVSK